MRLKLMQQPRNKHTAMVTGVGWTPSNELFSVSDDRSIQRWGLDGEQDTSGAAGSHKIVDGLDVFVTDMKWLSSVRGGNVTAELFVLGCSDGTFRLYNNLGRLDKTEKAHNGAVTSLAWNQDGTSLVTAGEDGAIKQYSRTGNLRSKLAQCDQAVYCVCWSPDQQSVLYCTGRYLIVKPLSVSAKVVKWKAHDATVLKVDWNPISNLIVSGSEDRKYKVWDSFGQLIFQSKLQEFGITSVSWSPSGEYFAVGSFNAITLCDKTGWTHSRSRANSGSIMALDWTADGTHLAGAGANGAVVFGQIVDRTLEWRNYEIRLDEQNHVHVLDVLTMDTSVANNAGGGGSSLDKQATETLEFGHRVIEMSLGFDHLIVATTRQCYVYHLGNWGTPHIFDLSGGTVSLILQASKCFLLVDKIRGLQIYSYEGRLISSPRLVGPAAGALNTMYLRTGNITLSNELVAVIDRATGTNVHLLDVASGKAIVGPGATLKHEIEIVEVALSAAPLGNVAAGNERKLVFIDRNRDLWLANLPSSRGGGGPGTGLIAPPYKLATQVDSAAWNESGTDILAAIVDGQMVFWYYPAVVHIDRDLLPLTKSDSAMAAGGAAGLLRGGMGGVAMGGDAAGAGGRFGKSAVLTSFVDTRVRVRRADGSVQTANMSPYPVMLYRFAAENSWTRCTRLARLVSREDAGAGRVLWAMLACMALQAAQLDTAEVALAAIEAVDKLQYIQSVKLIPSAEGRAAELALYRRQVSQAEEILLGADLVWRAIKMHISLFHWHRALELALKHKTHIDTVCAYRAKFLASLPPERRQEADPQFVKVNASLPPNALSDWATINSKIEAEARREEGRGTPYRTTMPLMNDADALAGLAPQQRPAAAAAGGASADVVGL